MYLTYIKWRRDEVQIVEELRPTFVHNRGRNLEIEVWLHVDPNFLFLGIVNGKQIPTELREIDNFIDKFVTSAVP